MENATLLKVSQKYLRFRLTTVKRALWVLFYTGLLLLCIYVAHTTSYLNEYRFATSYQSLPESKAPRTILLWNSFFHGKSWYLPKDTLGAEWFRDNIKCPVHGCVLTSNHEFLPSVEVYDAIVFHLASSIFWQKSFSSVPAKRNVRQLYVFALLEPPTRISQLLSIKDGFYNLTMTYRLDSDVIWPHYYFTDVESDEMVAPARHTKWRTPPSEWNDTQVWSLWASKTKTAAWFVSNCRGWSKREKLVGELQKFIDVDIYGNCGSLSCLPSSKECDDVLDRSYKFYFSFENSLCTDYATEKLYNALRRQVVPVVFGGADYSRFAPPHSHINAEDFESAQQLAAYLNYLSAHPEEYMRYFWWRRYYELHHGFTYPFCQLCEMLHDPAFLHKRQNYQNIKQWWMGGSCRSKARIKF